MKSVEELRAVIESLLEDAGFVPELYVIKTYVGAIAVQFDDEGAVHYFKREVDNSVYKDDLIFEYRRDGKRHVAYIQMW
mgnify:CR=1 FL=1